MLLLNFIRNSVDDIETAMFFPLAVVEPSSFRVINKSVNVCMSDCLYVMVSVSKCGEIGY